MSPPSLTPEQFARVRAIFEAALDRPLAERRAYSAGACGGDAALLLEVEKMLAAEEQTNTLLPREHSKAPSSTHDEGRFPAGTILGERYRVLGLLGRGGMGEVYRAFDLKLDQVVALKFLPPAANNSARLLERFRGEVRIARQVSHRNVCRVHDIGDVDGLAFLSMEYIDGDNLSALLQQVGRLPGDKALEYARRLCAGLAAAHERGVLHRDLKPANIMIDRRGQILITDFGLAAAADAIPGADIRSGTPAYMAPEQKEGREVTVRSDIYSLGLVLAEMFTGQKDTKTSATKDLDPSVERVIARCLDPDPRNRPDSAITVARMLPGGDPLAEALAAGETPTPGMVAASDDTGKLSVRWAAACLIFVIAGLAVAPYLGGKASIMGKTPFPYPPNVMAEKGRALAVRLGYTQKPTAESFRYVLNQTRLWAVEKLEPASYRAQLAAAQPGEVNFVLQQRFSDTATRQRGFPAYEDTLMIAYDPQGRLVDLYTSPPVVDRAPAGPVDWNVVLEAAGLDPKQWTPTEPAQPPPVRFDERAEWVGRYPSLITRDKVPREIRFEAAAWQGRIVFFHQNGPWLRETLATKPSQLLERFATGLNILFLLAIIAFACHSYYTGRADLQGAARLAGFVTLCNFLGQFFATEDALQVQALPVATMLGKALTAAAQCGVLYFAAEPFVRRHWPQVLIGWTRALQGQIGNALVGAHVLVGAALGVGLGVLLHLVGVFAIRSGTPSLYMDEMESLTIPGFSATLLAQAAEAPFLPIFLLFSLVFWRTVLRSAWLAGVVTVAILSFLTTYGSPAPLPIFMASAAQSGIMLLILTRFGVLPLAVGGFVSGSLNRFPLTSDFSAWYAVYGLLPILIIGAIALWSFRTTLSGRKVWSPATTL